MIFLYKTHFVVVAVVCVLVTVAVAVILVFTSVVMFFKETFFFAVFCLMPT